MEVLVSQLMKEVFGIRWNSERDMTKKLNSETRFVTLGKR
jgi:hypothetical protein